MPTGHRSVADEFALMKLRCIPEDFIVTELTGRVPTEGPYSLYELQKRSIGTLEAIQVIQRSWNLPPKNLSHGGLKDRHAVTTQYITIRGGPSADFAHDLFDLRYLGATDASFAAQDIRGNHFEITLRALAPDECADIHSRAESAVRGVANYFDEQRFGSLGASQQFVAAHWCMKDYERALWLALAEHNRHDTPTERAQKAILRDHWGDWSECKSRLDRSHRRSVVTYLVDHPDKFRKAFALVNLKLRGLYLSAFQSAVWNRMLAVVISERVSGTEVAEIEIGDATVPLPSVNDWLPLPFEDLPLPSVRSKGLSPAVRELCNNALEPYGMTLPQMKIHFPRDRWFSRAHRRTVFVPKGLSIEEAADDQYLGHRKLVLRFECPAGSYATMLIRTLTSGRNDTHFDAESETSEGEL